MSAATVVERLLRRVSPEPNSGCWLWTGSTGDHGYGNLRLAKHGKTLLAHRVSYEAHHGPIPTGLQIDHLCRVRCCINPAHLEAVTRQENARRGPSAHVASFRAGRCFRGHVVTPENIAHLRTGDRACRLCRNLRERQRKAATR